MNYQDQQEEEKRKKKKKKLIMDPYCSAGTIEVDDEEKDNKNDNR